MAETLLQGNCLELLPTIQDNSIDMILADLPYGTTRAKWDEIIPFDKLNTWCCYYDELVLYWNITSFFVSRIGSLNKFGIWYVAYWDLLLGSYVICFSFFRYELL